MNKQYIFTCPITKYRIEFVVDVEKQCAIMNYLLTDYKHLKPLFLLIRSSIDNLEKIGIKKIVQTIKKEEWDEYLKNKTTWKIINDDSLSIYDIECDISTFMENFGVGIGLL